MIWPRLASDTEGQLVSISTGFCYCMYFAMYIRRFLQTGRSKGQSSGIIKIMLNYTKENRCIRSENLDERAIRNKWVNINKMSDEILKKKETTENYDQINTFNLKCKV